MLSWHGSHFWVCITFCRVRHGDSVTKPDYYYYYYYEWNCFFPLKFNFLNFFPDKQNAFDRDRRYGYFHRDGWNRNVTSDGLLGYKLLIQTGDLNDPIDKHRVKFISKCTSRWYFKQSLQFAPCCDLRQGATWSSPAQKQFDLVRSFNVCGPTLWNSLCSISETANCFNHLKNNWKLY